MPRNGSRHGYSQFEAIMKYPQSFVALLLSLSGSQIGQASSIDIDLENVEDWRWPGASFWANRLQDWSVHDGQLQCVCEFGGNFMEKLDASSKQKIY